MGVKTEYPTAEFYRQLSFQPEMDQVDCIYALCKLMGEMWRHGLAEDHQYQIWLTAHQAAVKEYNEKLIGPGTGPHWTPVIPPALEEKENG